MAFIGFNEENTSGKRRIVPRGQTDGRADVSKLVATPHSFCIRFANSPPSDVSTVLSAMSIIPLRFM